MRVRINPVRAKFLPYFPPWRAGARPASNSLPVVRTRSAMVGFFIGVTDKTAPVRMVAMILFHGNEQWEAKVKKQVGQWLNIVVERNIKFNKKRKIKSTNGKFVTVNTIRTKYNLAWNGKRFASSCELDAMMDKRPKFYGEVESFAKKEWKAPVTEKRPTK